MLVQVYILTISPVFAQNGLWPLVWVTVHCEKGNDQTFWSPNWHWFPKCLQSKSHWAPCVHKLPCSHSDHFPSPGVYNWNRYTWQLKLTPLLGLHLWSKSYHNGKKHMETLETVPLPPKVKIVKQTQFLILGKRAVISATIKNLKDGRVLVPIIALFKLLVWPLQKLDEF